MRQTPLDTTSIPHVPPLVAERVSKNSVSRVIHRPKAEDYMIVRIIVASAFALLWSVVYSSALSAKAAPVVVKSRPMTCGEICAERFVSQGPGYRRCVWRTCRGH